MTLSHAKSCLLAGTAAALIALAATVGTASAADMALKAPPPPPAPILTWTGCYLGIEGGGVWGKETVVATTGSPGLVATAHPTGGIIGDTFGCNYQANSIVIGIENDFSWDGLRGSANDQPPADPNIVHTVSTDWLDTLRGRIGIAAGSALFYATGGVAFTRISDTAFDPNNGLSASNLQNLTGWTVGGGIEYMFAPRWSAKVEYLYVRFETLHDLFNSAPGTGGFFSNVDTRLTENIVRAGVNYHFNWPPMK